MEVAHCLSMKASRIELLLLFAALLALLYIQLQQSSTGISKDQAMVVAITYPLAGPAMSAEPLPIEEVPFLVKAPVASQGPKVPVQSLKERGDAMLFEIEALLGTPFDQVVVMPFE